MNLEHLNEQLKRNANKNNFFKKGIKVEKQTPTLIPEPEVGLVDGKPSETAKIPTGPLTEIFQSNADVDEVAEPKDDSLAGIEAEIDKKFAEMTLERSSLKNPGLTGFEMFAKGDFDLDSESQKKSAPEPVSDFHVDTCSIKENEHKHDAAPKNSQDEPLTKPDDPILSKSDIFKNQDSEINDISES